MALLIKESFTNETKGHHIGRSDWYEPFTDDRGKLYRSLQREYGRCVSKVYVDQNGKAKPVGWYFESRQQYEDTGRYGRPAEFYIRGVWVEVAEVVNGIEDLAILELSEVQ